MRFGAYLGNQAHAPANSRAALISGFAGGGTILSFAVRSTADGRLVLAPQDDVIGATGTPGKVHEMTLAQLRALDFSQGFVPRGSVAGEFHYFNSAVSGRRLAVDLLEDLLAELPRDVPWLIEAHGEGTGTAAATMLDARGLLANAILAFSDVAQATAVRGQFRDARTAVLALGNDVAEHEAADLLVLGIGKGGAGSGAGENEITRAARLSASYPMGVCGVLLSDAVPDGIVKEAMECKFWGLCVRSTFDIAGLRKSYVHAAESFEGNEVNHSHFALGYAKSNRYATVSWHDGVHIDIEPYDGPLPGSGGVPEERRLTRIEWNLIDLARTWPFYSGGGVGMTLGIADDFSAEVDYSVDNVGQATTLEMAVLNVDPGAHRGSPPATFRDRNSFYDPHGAPPYVGIEHDEDDGYRINWNFGAEYTNNQYGRPVGDGSTPRGARLLLQRRGAYFAAYYRDPRDASEGPLHPKDWVCVGVVRSDSMNRTVYLRCVGKRWRQEMSSDPTQFEPIIANSFVFRDLKVTCHVNSLGDS
jgi:hypothetical protein